MIGEVEKFDEALKAIQVIQGEFGVHQGADVQQIIDAFNSMISLVWEIYSSMGHILIRRST